VPCCEVLCAIAVVVSQGVQEFGPIIQAARNIYAIYKVELMTFPGVWLVGKGNIANGRD
jgi:hypothetical protein